MKLILTLGGAAVLAACTQANQDNAAANLDTNAGTAAGEPLAPVEDNAAGTDTLGNQLNQLNESGNAAGTGDSATGATENTVNSY